MAETKSQILTEETTKNQRLDKIFWFKVCISLLFGISFGLLKLKLSFNYLNKCQNHLKKK